MPEETKTPTAGQTPPYPWSYVGFCDPAFGGGDKTLTRLARFRDGELEFLLAPTP